MTRLFDTRVHYGTGSIAIHWLVAAVALMLLATGYLLLAMDRGPAKGQMIGFHTAVGWTLALLVLMRVAWRAVNPLPRLSGGKPWENALARTVQWALMLLLVAFVVTGYVAVATNPRLQSVSIFGWFSLPKLNDPGRVLHRAAETAHLWLSHLFAVLLALHGAGAAKRQFVDRDGTLRRMIRPEHAARGAAE